MKIFTNISEIIDYAEPINSAPENCYVSVGFFDGVHLGHRYVIDQLRKIARNNNSEEMLISLWPHPAFYFNKSIKLLTTLKEKIKILDDIGLKNLLILKFDSELAGMSSSEFLNNILVEKFKVKEILVGFNNSFGNKSKGNLEVNSGIISMTKLSNFTLFANIEISSSLIRNQLENGLVSEASELLGYKFTLTGHIEHGYEIGRKLGFPTANLKITENYKIIPADGVYIVEALIDNKWLPAMLNIGTRPTFSGTERTIEFNIINFDGNLYSKETNVRFLKRIREERKFENPSDLIKQLDKDRETVIEFFSQNLLNT